MTPAAGAERMMTGWLAALLMWEFGYQPRHRSTRQAVTSAGRLPEDDWDDHSFGQPGPPDWPGAPSDASWLAGPVGRPDYLDQLTSDEIRRLLEGCALDDVTRNVPDLVHAIGHSSHTTATLTSAWSNFRQSTRDAYALRLRARNKAARGEHDNLGARLLAAEAVELKLRQADDAWRLITNGLP
jgi:hypothetical protein